MTKVSLCSLLLLLLIAIHGTWEKSLPGSKGSNTKALRLASGKALSRPNRPLEELGGSGAFESDMTLTPDQMREVDGSGLEGRSRFRRKAVASDIYLWPHNTVAYSYDSNLPSRFQTTIQKAIQHWESLTCIRFRRYSPNMVSQLGHNSRVRFSHGAGCQSSIGRVSDVQETSIGDKCNTMGSVAHEIGHILGFYHEQSRPDRDQYVDVHLENVNPSFTYNFKKYGPSKVRTDEPYDVGSVMHYGSLYYSKDNQSPTIIPKRDDVKGFMGQRDGLSFMDVKTANDLYQCSAHCSSHVQCNNNGYMGPSCTCMCPWGLTGDTCDEVIPSTGDCGGVLTTRDGKFTSPNYPGSYGNGVTCHWLIKGPPGSMIQLWFNSFDLEDDQDGPCGYDWVEVRTDGPHLVGPKSCGGGPSSHYEYYGNSLYVRFHTDGDYSDFNGFEAGYAIEGGEYYYDDDNSYDGSDDYNDGYSWY